MKPAIALLLTAALMGTGCGSIRKLKTRHEATRDSLATIQATRLTQTHITEQAQGIVPYRVSSITTPVTAADTCPLQYETPDYTLRYTPPRPGSSGSIAIQGKQAQVPVAVSKTTDVTETDATTSNTRVKTADVTISKQKSSNTTFVFLLCLGSGVVLALLIWRLRKKIS